MDIEKNREPLGRQKNLRIVPGTFQVPAGLLSQKISFHSGPVQQKRRWRLMAWSLAAGMIDLLMMFAVSCFCLVGFLMVQGFHLSFLQIQHSVGIQWAMGATLLGFYTMYLLVLRVFLGCTVGEWACGLRLGEPRHRLSPTYSLKVHLRFFVTLLTGGLLLPLLSLVLGVDLAGKLSGLPLVSYTSK